MGARRMVQTGSQLGPYRLLRRIGSGGMAEVFLAQRIGAEGFARTVAIKTILAVGAEEEGISLFLDEARVAGFLEHAAIVQTVDLGYENDTLFIVMEYIAGPALSRVIRDLKKLGRYLSPEVVAYVGARVASALDYAHRRATAPDGTPLRLVHRDISPQNIMLTRTGMVKLTDFGVARASVQTHRTRTGQVRGKAAYMAPEQVRAGQLDGRTDVFALCLVLYEALTGVRAYQRKTDIMSMRAILTDSVQPIVELNPAAPDALVQVIMRGLAKKPQDRWASAGELAEALQGTYRSRSEALIEGEITAVIDELFGPEQFSSEAAGLPVEAWQPTITADAEGASAAPHKIPGAKLSPKIAALLQGPQPTSSSPDLANQVMSDIDLIPIDEASAISFSSGAASVPSSIAYAGIAQGAALRSGTNAAIDGAPAPAAALAPRTPPSGATPQPTPAPTDPRALAEPLYGSPGAYAGPNGYASTGGAYAGPAGLATPSALGTPAGIGATSGVRSLESAGAVAVPSRGGAVIWGSVGLGVLLVAGVSVALWTRDGARPGAVVAAPVKSAVEAHAKASSGSPSASAEPTAEQPGAERPTAEKPGVERPGVERSSAEPSTAEAPAEPTKRAKAQGAKADAAKADPAKADPAKADPAKTEQHADAQRAEPTKAEPKKRDGAEAFLARAAAAKRRAEADPELKKQLTTLIMDISVAPREPTPAELELVRRAEAK